MFYKTLLVLSQQLNDYLKLSFRLTEDIVYLCSVKIPIKRACATRSISVCFATMLEMRVGLS